MNLMDHLRYLLIQRFGDDEYLTPEKSDLICKSIPYNCFKLSQIILGAINCPLCSAELPDECYQPENVEPFDRHLVFWDHVGNHVIDKHFRGITASFCDVLTIHQLSLSIQGKTLL